MKKYLFIVLLTVFSSCIKKPVYNITIESDVCYSFSGGMDLLSVFQIVSNYTSSNGLICQDTITELPWTHNEKLIAPCDAELIISFTKKNDIFDRDYYYLGFSSDITYSNSVQSYSDTKVARNALESEYDTIKFCIDYHDQTKAENAVLSIPPLKYNKHFAYSYTTDDSAVGAYARLWRRINRKWMDSIEFFHSRCTPTAGYQPLNTLGFSDGCGNERRFPIGVAIWPNVYSQYLPNGIIEDYSSSIYSPYITWEELNYIVDFGGSIYYHNVDEQKYDKQSSDDILKGIEDDRVKTLNKLERSMKIMSQPDGNKSYLTASEQSSEIVMIRTEENSPKINLEEVSSLYKKRLYSGFTENRSGQLEEMENQSISDSPYWISFSTHRVDSTVVTLFEEINKNYGKEGKDDIWFATIDEIYEYVTMRENSIITKTVSGNKAYFEVIIPTKYNFYYKDISFITNQISDDYSLEVLSDNIVGAFSNVNENNILININFNPKSILLAEKYTSIFENTLSELDKEDALYFTTFLSPSIASSYIARINSIDLTPVILTSVTINNGDKYSFSPDINISLDYQNTPTHYKVWEGDNKSADWKTFESDKFTYKLSNTYGEKVISAKIKNNVSESESVSSSVFYYPEPDENTVLKANIKEYLDKYNGYQLTKTISIPATIE